MTALGIAIAAVTVLTVVIAFFLHKQHKFPLYGWLGVGLLAAAYVLLFRGVWVVAVYFTPIAWTADLLIVDAAVLAISGRSRLHDAPGRFVLTALLSIPLWLIFEAYNLRLQNWTYVGLPKNEAAALLGYGWSFATITPGIFEAADLVESFGWFKPARPVRFSVTAQSWMVVIGAACLVVPVVIPARVGAYLFGLVWAGFVLLLDPINRRLELASLLGDLVEGRRSRLYSLLASGWICGWLWESWNYWSAAKWHYTFPMFQNIKIFEMPAPGFLGFLPFALECFTMYVTADWLVKTGWRRTSGNHVNDLSVQNRSMDVRFIPSHPTIAELEKMAQDCEERAKNAFETEAAALREEAERYRKWARGLRMGPWIS